ncbi:MAG TPA: FHA domain-containing protein [Candidatus Binataceae bacterium]|nr:FHA domain-containing protein [Candidatus Binataceae bacterium]
MAAAAQPYAIPSLPVQVPRLVSLPGDPSREHRMIGKRALIGSGGEADFVLMDPTVARRHAEIVKKHGGRYVLTDLKSIHGTFVNGKQIKPDVEYPIGSADDLRFGALHFTFLLPDGAQDSLRSALQRRMRVEGIVTVLLLISIVLSYIVPKESWESLIPHRGPHSSAMVMSDTWLSKLNEYRQSTGLPEVTEADALSKGDANHARYVVANQAAMLRSGNLNASIHDEDPSRPFFTPEGKNAGELSDVDGVFTDPPQNNGPSWAIENWITGPFHRMWLLNPALHRVGYGQYCEKGLCAAALDIHSGAAGDSQFTSPVMFPADRSTIRNGTFTADEVEWPDPLASCGYHAPTGLPITLQIGGAAPAHLESYSLKRNGKEVATCAFDASSYKSADKVAVERVRKQLAQFGAIVMVPKEPLAPGAMYTVQIFASGQTYSWWFGVEP